MKVSLSDQAACVKREIGMRRRNYPRWVAEGRMTQEKAATEIAAMEAVAETLALPAVTGQQDLLR